jgi:dethiobiotin synthetase
MTEACIGLSGCRLAGWIGNLVEPDMAAQSGNLDTLRTKLSAPCLGVVPWLDDPSPKLVSPYLDPIC